MTATMHPARGTDPGTSHAAARINRDTLIAEVRAILSQHPEGLTDDDLWDLTGYSWARHGSVVKARKHAGAVESGRYGVSRSKCKATIWVLPEDES